MAHSYSTVQDGDYLPQSDETVVRQQIQERSKRDPYWYTIRHESIHPMMSNGVPYFNSNLICVYADLDRQADEAKQSKVQRDVIRRFMMGWKSADIADMMEQTRQTVDVHLSRAVIKIVEANNDRWMKSCEQRHKANMAAMSAKQVKRSHI